MNPDTELKTERDWTAACLVAGSELATAWFQCLGDKEQNIRDALQSGWGLELVVSLHPNPSVDLRLVDLDGTRIRLAARVINSTNAH